MKYLLLIITFSCFLLSDELEISGTPFNSGKEESPYSFIPSVDAEEEESIIFSIVNKPSWANFNYKTGKLSGTPKLGEEGSYEDIVISVKEGNLTAHLESFDINVIPLKKEESYTMYKFLGLLLSFFAVLFVV